MRRCLEGRHSSVVDLEGVHGAATTLTRCGLNGEGDGWSKHCRLVCCTSHFSAWGFCLVCGEREGVKRVLTPDQLLTSKYILLLHVSLPVETRGRLLLLLLLVE